MWVVFNVMLFLFLLPASSLLLVHAEDIFKDEPILKSFSKPPFVPCWLWISGGKKLPLWPRCGPSRPRLGPFWPLVAPWPLLMSLSFILLPLAGQMFTRNAADKEKAFHSHSHTQRERQLSFAFFFRCSFHDRVHATAWCCGVSLWWTRRQQLWLCMVHSCDHC